MGLSDFWDNITNPRFLENALEEFRDICLEAKEEFHEIFEDGQELVTDAFQYSAIEKKGEYTFTSEKRRTARETMEKAREDLLLARGINDENRFLFDFADLHLKKLIKELREVPPEQLDRITKEVHDKLDPISVADISQLKGLRKKLLRQVKLPPVPKYIAPEDKLIQINTGRYPNRIPDRAKRHLATEAFIDAVEECQKQIAAEVENLNQEGPSFRLNKLPENQIKALEKLCQSLTLYFFETVDCLSSLIAFGMTGKGDPDQIQKDKETSYHERAKTAVERLSCFYTMATFALGDSGNSLPAITDKAQQVIDQIILEIPETVETEDYEEE